MKNAKTSKWRFGCGERYAEYVPHGYDYKEISVECGSTSPSGDPWQCEACAEKYKDVDFRADAMEHGESY